MGPVIFMSQHRRNITPEISRPRHPTKLGRQLGGYGGHAAAGDVAGGVEKAAPDDIEHGDPNDAQGWGEIADPELVDEDAAQAHRDGHPLDPGAEASVLGGLGGAADAAHAKVGEGVHDFGG